MELESGSESELPLAPAVALVQALPLEPALVPALPLLPAPASPLAPPA